MAREARYRRSSGAIRDSRGYVRDLSVAPSTDRRLVERRVGNRDNPYEGLSAGASRVANQIYIGASQMSQGLGRIAGELGRTADIATRHEIAKIDQENKELTLKARLDHVRGVEYQHDSPAYEYERKRLETLDQIQEAQRQKAIQQLQAARAARRGSGGGGGRRRRSSGGSDTVKAMQESAARQEALSAISQGPGAVAVASEASQEMIANMAGDQAIAAFDLESDGYQTGGMNVADQYSRLHDTVIDVTEGLPETTRALAQERAFDKLDNQFRKEAVAEQKARVNEFRASVVELAQTDFLEGILDGPDSIEAAIARTTVAYNGDVQTATTKTINAVSDAATMRIQQGDRASYHAYRRAIEPLAQNNPDLWEDSYAPVTNHYEKLIEAEAKADVTAIESAIREAEAVQLDPDASELVRFVSGFKPALEMLKGAKSWSHPEFQEGIKAVQEFNARAAEENRKRRSLMNAISGGVVEDPDGARDAAVPLAVEAYQIGDLKSVATISTAVREVPGPVGKSIRDGLRTSTSVAYYTQTDDDGNGIAGPGMMVDKAYKMLVALPPELQTEALGTQENIAYFAALNHLAANDPQGGIEDAKRQVDQTISQVGSVPIRQASKGNFDPRQLFPDTRKAEADQMLMEHVVDAVERQTGATINGPMALIEDVRIGLAFQQVFSGGQVPGVDDIDQFVAHAIATKVKIPGSSRYDVISGVIAHRDHELVDFHPNRAVAREGMQHWPTNSSELFNQATQQMSFESPFIIVDDPDIPLSLEPAPTRDARHGYMRVMGSGRMTGRVGLPVMVSPGSSFEYSYQAESADPRIPDGVRPLSDGSFNWPDTVEDFEKAIRSQNGLMSGTGFIWKMERDDADSPVYYLAYRPYTASTVVNQTLADANQSTQIVNRTVDESIALFDDMMRQDDLDAFLNGPLGGPDRDLKGLVEEVVHQMARMPDSPIPANIGTTVQIPEFENSQQVVEWFQEAYRTKLITGRAGRPYPTQDPSMPDEWNMLETLKGRNGFSARTSVDPQGGRKTIGGGVPIQSDWVRERLRQYGLDDSTIREVAEGKQMLRGNLAEAITIDAFKHGEKVLRDREIAVLPELPWESYSTLVALAIETPENITPKMVQALNARDWRTVEAQIRTTDKPTHAYERVRHLDANTFVIGLGLKVE